MVARPQWYFWSIGRTNSVQPYCRLAIITMQMMPKTSCAHRYADIGGVLMVAAVIFLPDSSVVYVRGSAHGPALGRRNGGLCGAFVAFNTFLTQRLRFRRSIRAGSEKAES